VFAIKWREKEACSHLNATLALLAPPNPPVAKALDNLAVIQDIHQRDWHRLLTLCQVLQKTKTHAVLLAFLAFVAEPVLSNPSLCIRSIEEVAQPDKKRCFLLSSAHSTSPRMSTPSKALLAPVARLRVALRAFEAVPPLNVTGPSVSWTRWLSSCGGNNKTKRPQS
jgi:hypothetical protein